MLQIWQSQLDALASMREHSIARDVVRELRTSFAADVAAQHLEQHLDWLVGLGIDRERSHGIRDEDDRHPQGSQPSLAS